MEDGKGARVYKAAEVAELLRISKRMAQLLAAEGELPAFKVGSEWRFNEDEIDDFRYRRGKFSAPPGSVAGQGAGPVEDEYSKLVGVK